MKTEKNEAAVCSLTVTFIATLRYKSDGAVDPVAMSHAFVFVPHSMRL